MPRKKKAQFPPLLALALVVGGLLLFGGLPRAASNVNGSASTASGTGDSGVFVFAVLVLAGIALLAWANVVLPRQRRDAMVARVDAVTDAHMGALIRQQMVLIHTDAYGKPVTDRWMKEIEYFVTNHVRPVLDANQLSILDSNRAAIIYRIWQRVSNAANQTPAVAAISAPGTPAEFEVYCAETLRAYGWTVVRTPLAHDQGVDVIAEKNGVRVVLQCKLYSNPVGNKAVQEIAAGRAHQQAHYGAVVTNNSYTRSAKELATTNGIWLLHFSELPQLEHRARGPGLQPTSVPYVSA
jgi:restriction system protein